MPGNARKADDYMNIKNTKSRKGICTRMRHHVSFILILTIALTLLSAGQASAQKTEPELLPYSNEKRYEIVGRIGDEQIVRETLYWFNSGLREKEHSTKDIFTKKNSELEDLLNYMAIVQTGAKRAMGEDSPLSEEIITAAERQAERLTLETTFQRFIMASVPPIKDSQVQAFYEANSSAFTTPMTFSIRHIYISNYVPVETKEGDTFESLAKRISGSTQAIDRILIDNPQKTPRAPEWSTGNRETIKPLEPGELLLVPVSDKQKAQNRRRIEAAYKELENGASFAEVAEKYSENATKGQVIEGLRKTGKPMLPQVMEAVEQTDEGEYSDIFQTKHGFNIIEIVEKEPAKSLELSEVRDTITQRLLQKAAQEKARDFVKQSFAADYVKIHYDKIRDADTPGDAIILEAGDLTVPKRALDDTMLGPFSSDTPESDIMAALKANAEIRSLVLLARAKELGVQNLPEYRGKLASGPHMNIYQEWLKTKRAEIENADISAEEAREYFEKNRQDFNRQARFTYYVLGKKVDTTDMLDGEKFDAIAEAKRDMARYAIEAKSLDRFKQLIREHSELSDADTNEGLQEKVPVSRIPEALLTELTGMRPGQIGRPVYTDNFVLLPWLVATEPGGVMTYSEAKDQLPELVKQVQLAKFPGGLYEELLKEARVEVK